ncbi:MAG: ATP-binding cassette domain-containing protein [Phycisphaerales bacterium]|nr:ATP-binding cassette domain-containing protein [Phycisphaerales bacterium]
MTLRPTDPAIPPRVEIRVEGLSKSFGEHEVLRNISFDVMRGQIVAIVGASGSGKTVLMHLMAGLIEPSAGRVLVADHSDPAAPLVDLLELDEDGRDRVRMSWAMVFQRNALFSGSVFENVALLLREHTALDERGIAERVRASLKAAALDVDDVIQKDRDELSGGMAKRVAIARAIAIDPALIFYDEPTTGLDPVFAGLIQDLIWNTHYLPRETGGARTTVIVTHDKDLLRRLHPRVIMLHRAGICLDAPYEHLANSGCEAAEEYLRAMPVLHARPAPF